MDVTKPRNILLVITKANWGGAQRYVYDVAVAARNVGHTVTVAYGMPGELSRRLAEVGIPNVHVAGLERDIKAGSDMRAFRELLKLMKDLRPDVVHSNSSKAGGIAAFAARLSGVKKIIFTAHGWAFNEKRPAWQKLVIFLLHYITVLLSDTTICVSEAVRKDVRRMPFVQKRLVIVRNGVPAIEFLDKETARNSLGAHIQDQDLLWVGTIAELHPTKQIDVAIRAFAKVIEKNPGAHYFIIGEGQLRTELERLIQEFNLEDRIHLSGHVSEASKYLSAFDLFVLPSRSEGLAYVILEAGMAQLPVVASRVGGIPEVISDNTVGVLIPSGNVDVLAENMERLISDPTLRKQYGIKLNERVRSEFSLAKMIEETLKLYH